MRIMADGSRFSILVDAETFARAADLANLFALDVHTFVATIINALHADEVDEGRLPERGHDAARPA